MKKSPSLLRIFILSIPVAILLIDALLCVLCFTSTHNLPPIPPNNPGFSAFLLCIKVSITISACAIFQAYSRTKYPELLDRPAADRYFITQAISIPPELLTALITLPAEFIWAFIAFFIYGSLAYSLVVLGAVIWIVTWSTMFIRQQRAVARSRAKALPH